MGFSLSIIIDTTVPCPHCGFRFSTDGQIPGSISICPKCGKPIAPLKLYTGSMVASGLVGGTLDTVEDTVSVLDGIPTEEQKALGIFDLAPQFKDLATEVVTLKGRFDKLAESVAKRKEFVEVSKEREVLFIPEKVLKKLPTEVAKTLELIWLCFGRGIPQACPPFIRKALESAIHIRFRMDSKEMVLYDDNGKSFGLSKKIELARQAGYMSYSLAQSCYKTKLFGDISLHDWRIDLEEGDIIPDFRLLRLVLECMYGR